MAVRIEALGTLRNGVNFNQSQEGLGLPVVKVKDFGSRFSVPESGLDELDPTRIDIANDLLLRDGDTLIIRSNGNGDLVGRCLFVQTVNRPITFSGFCIRFRPDPAKVNPKYATYLLRSPLSRQQMVAFGSGTGIQNLNQQSIGRIEVDLPPLPEQNSIVDLLGCLDEKIELNERANRQIETLATALFRSWFVDFDPVAAMRNGTTPVGVPADAVGLFPSHFENSELGPIPQGWRIDKLTSFTKTQYGFTDSASWEPVGPHFLRITDMNKEPWIDWSRVPFCKADDSVKERYGLHVGDIVVSRMADPGKAGIVEEPVEAVFASYLVRLEAPPFLRYWLYYFLRSDEYRDYAEGAQGGTVQANMNAQVIVAARAVVPPKEMALAFDSVVRPLRQQIVANVTECRTLAKLRDTLLEPLLLGELTIKSAETAIGAVL